MPDEAAPLLANRTPIRIGGVGLRVRDLERVTSFYRDLIGLQVLAGEGGNVQLGAADAPLVTLIGDPNAAPAPRGSAGLFHTAFLMPTRRDLAGWLVHVARRKTPLTGYADHDVSEAVYLDDPEGNGIEVYADRPPENWVWQNGTIRMGTDPLDVDNLVSLAEGSDEYKSAPRGLRVGHVHLRVGDVARGEAFYRDALGLQATYRRPDASFLSSGGYHHHIAVNIWQSAGAGRRVDGQAGLEWLALEIAEPVILDAQRQRLDFAAVDGGSEARDPWGTRVRLIQR